MTRKIPVVSWNDDGSTHKIVDVDADKLRAQRKAREAEVARVPAPVKGPRDMLRHLAVHKLDPDFAIPAAVVDAIAIALAGKGGWLKAQKALQEDNEKKRLKADRRQEEVRRAAECLRVENPGIGNSDIEKALAKTYSCSARTIRRYITKG